MLWFERLGQVHYMPCFHEMDRCASFKSRQSFISNISGSVVKDTASTDRYVDIHREVKKPGWTILNRGQVNHSPRCKFLFHFSQPQWISVDWELLSSQLQQSADSLYSYNSFFLLTILDVL